MVTKDEVNKLRMKLSDMRVSELQDAALMLEIEELRLTINDVLALLRPKNRPFTLKHKNQLTSLAKMLKSEEEKE